MLSHCHCVRKSERDSMHFLWLQSARWLGFPGGTDNYNFDIPCGSGGRLKCLPQGVSDVVTPLRTRVRLDLQIQNSINRNLPRWYFHHPESKESSLDSEPSLTFYRWLWTVFHRYTISKRNVFITHSTKTTTKRIYLVFAPHPAHFWN